MTLYVFKVLIIGPGAVGKTSLLHRFVENKFSFRYKLTIGADFLAKVIQDHPKPGSTIKMQIWDIGGQERYKFLRSSFFDGANGALIVFDLSRWHTFEEIDEWLSDLYEYAGKDVPFALIGNKADLINSKDELYERESAQVFAKKEKTFYVETSAKTGEKVEDAFLNLAELMIKKINPD
ncbi:MAG: GTP-binding protein [Promethearchaeota archaeon]